MDEENLQWRHMVRGGEVTAGSLLLYLDHRWLLEVFAGAYSVRRLSVSLGTAKMSHKIDENTKFKIAIIRGKFMYVRVLGDADSIQT